MALSGSWPWFLVALTLAGLVTCSTFQDEIRFTAAGGKASTPTTNGSLKWAWLHGEMVGNQHTNEVEILFSHEKPSVQASKKHGFFYPGSRAGTTWWQVSDGTFWMFGGEGFDDKPTEEPRLLNDLWEFDTTKQTWSLIDDVDPANTREDSNQKGPIPRPRKLAASCGVKGLVFIVFGGEDMAGKMLNDTWAYNESHSEWIILDLDPMDGGPSARKDMAYWCSGDKLVIFGGVDSNGRTLQDMWEFSLRTLLWQQVQLQPDKPVPAKRAGPLTWVVPDGMLYLYGGFTMGTTGRLTGWLDLWQFDQYNQTWTFKDSCNNATHANDTRSPSGMSKKPGGMSLGGDCPGARRHGAAWVETSGNLWMFGGEIIPLNKHMQEPIATASTPNIRSSLWLMSDLWRFNVTQPAWTWMGMAEKPGMMAHYGTNYQPSATNHPGARCQMVSWTRKGQMFLYGGLGLDARNKTAFLNDVWLVTHSEAVYAFKVEHSWFRRIPPTTVFLATLGSFGGVVLAFGVGFYLKKMLESPNHNPSEFQVKYSRVRQDTFD